MRILNNPGHERRDAAIAQVTFSDSAGFGAVGSSEARGIPVFAPRGISYVPCEGDRLLMLPVDGTETCVGCLCAEPGLPGGELKLSSAGGAVILLKNNGEIILNGLRISREGKILNE